MLVFIGCSEIYDPKIDPTAQALVVQGIITDGNGPFTINLTTALLYTSDPNARSLYVTGAKLKVTDNENNVFNLTETKLGNYTLPLTFRAKIGNSYKLNIQTTNGNIYESDSQKLIPPQYYDSIRSVFTQNNYVNNMNDLALVDGANILVQLFKSVTNTDPVPYCRFDANMTIQNTYPIYIKDTVDWHWIKNDWNSFDLNVNENITDDNHLTTNPFIQNYLVAFAPTNTSTYGMGTDAVVSLINSFEYLRISQYTMNAGSYRFYKEANKQLTTTYDIFDPVTSQLYSNLKCINNPSKIVLGLFEVSSVVQTAYLMNKESFNKTVTLTKVPYADFHFFGVIKYKIWDNKNKPQPDQIEYLQTMPFWWYHK